MRFATRRDVLGLCVGMPLAGWSTSTLLSQPTTVSGAGHVTPNAFGAVPNDPRAAMQNVRAFNAMGEHALRLGLTMVIPRGTWFLAADGRTGPGWELRPGRNGRCVIRGEGPTSVLVRAPAQTASKFASLVRLWVQLGGEQFDIQGLRIEGNETQFPFDAKSPWAYQQSHSLEFASQSVAAAAAAIRLSDIVLSGVVADGIKVGAQCERFDAQRIFAFGRSRRTRSDIQFSRLPRAAVLSDIEVDAFEAEPSAMVPGATMQLTNIVARSTFDLFGPEDDPNGRLRVIGVNCRAGLQPGTARHVINFYRLTGSFTGCSFAGGAWRSRHNNMIRASSLAFNDSEILTSADSSAPSSASPFVTHFDKPEDRLEFRRCAFRSLGGAAGGAYVHVRSGDAANLIAADDCSTDGALDYLVSLDAPASVRVSGGTIGARRAVVRAGGRAARQARLDLRNSAGWRAPRLVEDAGG